MLEILKDVHKDLVKPDEKKYTPYGAFSWEIPGDWTPKFTENMGDDICIIDIDNRPFDEHGQAFGDTMIWDDIDHLHGISLGLLNHWLYGKTAILNSRESSDAHFRLQKLTLISLRS